MGGRRRVVRRRRMVRKRVDFFGTASSNTLRQRSALRIRESGYGATNRSPCEGQSSSRICTSARCASGHVRPIVCAIARTAKHTLGAGGIEGIRIYMCYTHMRRVYLYIHRGGYILIQVVTRDVRACVCELPYSDWRETRLRRLSILS